MPTTPAATKAARAARTLAAATVAGARAAASTVRARRRSRSPNAAGTASSASPASSATTGDAPPPDWDVGTPWAAVRASGLFDAGWYAQAHAPSLGDHVDPLWHYAHVGGPAGLDPNPVFDRSWYLDTYPDVDAAGVDPVVHYLEHGVAEHRDPGPGFDTDWYLRSNPDVRASRGNPLAHYLSAGVLEGRPPAPGAQAGPRLSVLLVSGEPDTPGHQYRVARLAGTLERLGCYTTVTDVPGAASRDLGAVDTAALVVLWRTAWGDEVETVVHQARRHRTPVVFDVDDLMVDPTLATVAVVDGIRSQDLTEAEAADWFARMGRTASEADVCTCTTEGIATALRLLGRPTFVMPNGVDDVTVARSNVARRARDLAVVATDDGVVRLGYAGGSRTHQRDLAVAAPAIAAVLRDHANVRLVLFRDTVVLDDGPVLAALDGLADRIEWREVVSLSDLPDELARFDVNLAPLEVGNPFCEAKSDLKHFEAALVGVPTVASPTASFRDAIRDGVDGFLCDSDDRWRDALESLVTDPALRARVGAEARRRVTWRRGELARLRQVDLLVEQLTGGRSAARAFELARWRDGSVEPAAPPTTAHTVEVIHDRLAPSRVTVVVPVHDYADVVLDALDSVAHQTLEDLDLIVVDDAATDGSAEVVAAWLDDHAGRFGRAVLVRHHTNAGVACARNIGFDLAATPWVLPLDADNALAVDCCRRLLDALEGTDAVAAYPRSVLGEHPTVLDDPKVTRGYLPYAPQRLVGSNWIDAVALMRVDAWAMAGGYRTGLVGWEDYDLWCRFAELGLRIVGVPEDLAFYRVHDHSMLHTLTDHPDHAGRARDAITGQHPWLRLTPDPTPGTPTPREAIDTTPTTAPRPAAPPHPGASRGARTRRGLDERGRAALDLLRCPITGERLETDPGGGVRTVLTGRRWPVVDGRPVLDPSGRIPDVHPDDHAGNPLPDRARQLVATATGPVLQLSGGGTSAGPDAIELDLDLYRPTNVVADAHHLPFDDGAVNLVLALNAFEHYRRPDQVVAEIHRVLTPGGLVFVHTAFLQPEHETPHHYFNATRWGVHQWFAPFEPLDLAVPDNFHGGHTLAWLAAEATRLGVPDITLSALAELWHDPARRPDDPTWAALAATHGPGRDTIAAGFEYLGRRR